MAEYDAGVIKQFAQSLYAEAKGVIVKYTIWFDFRCIPWCANDQWHISGRESFSRTNSSGNTSITVCFYWL